MDRKTLLDLIFNQKPQLATPTISLSGNTLSIEDVENAEYYDIYDGDTLIATLQLYQSITTSVTNGTYSGDSSICIDNTATITISADSGYVLPSSVTVTNATLDSYDSSTGVIVISNATGPVSISATCIRVYNVTTSVTNGTYSGDATILDGSTATVTIAASSGYKLPSSVVVSGATSSYNSSTGVISLSNPTGNVTISATCEVQASTGGTVTITVQQEYSGGSKYGFYVYDGQDSSGTLLFSNFTRYPTSPVTTTVNCSSGYLYIYMNGGIVVFSGSATGGVTPGTFGEYGEDSQLFEVNGNGTITFDEIDWDD